MLSALPEYNSSVTKQDIDQLFAKQKEFDFMNVIAAELHQKVIGQYVYYFKVDKERTETNIYGESKEKIVQGEKVKVPCTVSEVIKPVNDSFGIRFDKSLRVAFLLKLLDAYGISNVFQGDYLEFQQKNYEIVSIERHRKFYGNQEQTFELIATCKVRE